MLMSDISGLWNSLVVKRMFGRPDSRSGRGDPFSYGDRVTREAASDVCGRCGRSENYPEFDCDEAFKGCEKSRNVSSNNVVSWWKEACKIKRK